MVAHAGTARLPRHKGDLELINHSAGSITSQTYMKRWNRMNEVLADGAERSSAVAAWLGGRPYPLERLNRAWDLVLGSQMHDIIPGTSIPKAYEYSWNDEILAANQFGGVLTSAAQSVASVLDTRAEATWPSVSENPGSAQAPWMSSSAPPQIRAPRRRSALAITVTGLRLIAAAASIGDSSQPVQG